MKRSKINEEDVVASADRWKRWILIIGILFIGAYFVFFGVVHKQQAAIDAEKWGQFGDFFGGILNPIVAFSAFYWLTQSVKLQKFELGEARKEMRLATAAQKNLVQNGYTALKLSALTAMMQSIESQLSSNTSRLSVVTEKIVSISGINHPVPLWLSTENTELIDEKNRLLKLKDIYFPLLQESIDSLVLNNNSTDEFERKE